MDKYFEFLEKHCQYDYSMYVRPHLSRAHTFSYIYHCLPENPVIVELGTTRSYVHGGLEGCMDPDIKYLQKDNPETWDWGAGAFTRVFAELAGELHTVDIVPLHIEICQNILEDFNNIKYHVSDSFKFLKLFDKFCDLIYMDVGDMTPLEPSARLHERDAMIIVERGLVKVGGYILIDDVRNPHPFTNGEVTCFGKAKYSLAVLLANGFDIVMDEYQLILRRMI